MKKKIVKQASNKKCSLWLLIVVAFVLGTMIGYATHYTIINWNGFFATCPNGKSPDKNGCCTGETYTDAGNGWMVCCPDNGGDCFPPIK